MPDAISSRSLHEITVPLAEEQKIKFKDVLDFCARHMKQREQDEKRRPYLDFMVSAHDAGFTEEQAEFLWQHRPRPEWRG